MTQTELQDALKTMLEEIAYMDADDRDHFEVPDELDDIESVQTFEEAGVLTRDAGFVCRLGNGCEYQVTIVRSR